MSRKTRLREKAIYHYSRDDSAPQAIPDQEKDKVVPRDPIETHNFQAEPGSMPSTLSHEGPKPIADVLSPSAPLASAKLKRAYRKLSQDFVIEQPKAVAVLQQAQTEAQPKPSALRFESIQVKPVSALSFEKTDKSKRVLPLRNTIPLPSPWHASHHTDEGQDSADRNASRDVLQSAEKSAYSLQSQIRLPHAQAKSRTMVATQRLQAQSLRQRAEDFATLQVKKQPGKNALSRYFQKQHIKREYLRAYRSSARLQAKASSHKAAQGAKKVLGKLVQLFRSRAAVYLAIALVLLLLVGSIASFAFSATTVMGGSIMGGLGESLRGSEGMVEVARSQLGQVGGEPYWSWYGFPSRVEWCAIFVSWVADQNGFISDGRFPKFAGCSVGESWFRSAGAWQEGGYQPSPGEVIFFDWNGDRIPDHVGIVESCDGSTVYTIEGNWGDSVHTDAYQINSPYIYGYGTPNYFE